MNIVACVKQVPDTEAQIRVKPDGSGIEEGGIKWVMNPYDEYGVEEALRLKEKYGGHITAISMGPPAADAVLKKAMALGVDEAILLSDRVFGGADTLATSLVLSEAIRKLDKQDPVDIVLCGKQTIDGDTAQVGPQIAGFLGLPQITYATSLSLKDETLTAERSLEDCIEVVQVKLPALVTVTAEINQPRYPSLFNLRDACSGSQITFWHARDLNVPHDMLGLSASPTWVKKIFTPEHEKRGTIFPGTEKEMANALLQKLRELNFIQ